MNQTRIIVIAKEPLPGTVKTRLIPALGEIGAARLADRMLRHTLTQALTANIGPVELCVSPDPAAEYWQQLNLGDRAILSSQAEGDLGHRMAEAARNALTAGLPVILIGTDCPDLDANRLRQMAGELQNHDACLCPVADGGYALLGLRRFSPTLFTDIPWSTEQVAAITRQRLATLGWRLAESETLHDVDEPADLQRLATDYPGLMMS
ncbi:TIGR04282 family arsenosugar biosynthesis glycosyltransferase [Marinobacter nauticus]|jgi:rSAM/selenodomain-associated transferase 1|uniref:TIGR04282 family arsenosugar biosynthesis glycosyltransferase n=1 Tax=Marinobacter nauticus TaxID=2743 RepID=UPI000EC8F881|nr:glycosyltransferase [Marinobacter nauticus]|tara:strand:- start:2069 stop:2692 length:624 start_codon:yes stop_codon:yes gene_type:complete